MRTKDFHSLETLISAAVKGRAQQAGGNRNYRKEL